VAQKIDVPFPEDVLIGDGWTIEWDAVDPTTGASVSGVIVKEANVTAGDASDGTVTTVQVGPFMLVPGPSA
jgi:hypothetical protein